jgi:protein tyrosine/serine phosphatase
LQRFTPMTVFRVISTCLIAGNMIASERGLPHFEKVDEHVYRGCQPDDEGFATLHELGVKTVIDMRGGWIHMPREKRLVNEAGLRYIEERFSGFFEPHDAQVAKLLVAMEDPASTPVLVHCRRGADRVGLLIACYRIAHDHWTNEQALAEACRYGLSPLEVLMRSYIRHFDPARLKLAAPAETGLPTLFPWKRLSN